MISKKLQKAINDQIQAEYYSAYMYLGMSTHFAQQSLNGFAHWFKAQFEEEMTHGHKLMGYLLERGGVVELKDIQATKDKYTTPLLVFEKVLAHEQHVTSLIDNLYQMAIAEKDNATCVFLQWFINEQVEEEATASEIVEKMKRIPDNSAALFYFDDKLGQR